MLWTIAAALATVACSGAAGPTSSSPDDTSAPGEDVIGSGSIAESPSTAEATPADTGTAPSNTGLLGEDFPTSTGEVASAEHEVAPDCESQTQRVDPAAGGASTTLERVGSFPGGVVYAGVYPVPDDLGDPWSQWGEGVVLPDGRFISGVGDHRGVDGRSWFYEYDPNTRQLTQTAEVGAALGHRQGDWGYGKLHAPMVLDRCDKVLTATYWGTRRNIEFGRSYTGDHLIRYDPDALAITSLGVPVRRHGLPSLALSPDRSTVFLEAVDPRATPPAGAFVVADADDGTVSLVERYPDHGVFRDILVTADGEAFVGADNGLRGVSPDNDPITEPGVFGGESVLRSASRPSTSGQVAISTRRPDEMWLREASGELRSLGDNEGYVASVALSLDGSTIYYVPGAHGAGLGLGTPLMALDTTTTDRRVLVRLNDMIEPALTTRVGGSYNVVLDDDAGRIFVGLNGADTRNSDEETTFGSVVLAVVEFDEMAD